MKEKNILLSIVIVFTCINLGGIVGIVISYSLSSDEKVQQIENKKIEKIEEK